jgi:benzodiazapine receptor
MIKLKPLVLSLLISLGVGGLSGLLISGSTGVYESALRPPLSPPAAVFPVVWTILYILMGISAYLIWMSSPSPERKRALTIYGVQLGVNFIWPLLFFCAQAFFPAFLWLVLLLILVIVMISAFSRLNRTAALLQVPYLVWTVFAAYLNLGVWFLNR